MVAFAADPTNATLAEAARVALHQWLANALRLHHSVDGELDDLRYSYILKLPIARLLEPPPDMTTLRWHPNALKTLAATPTYFVGRHGKRAEFVRGWNGSLLVLRTELTHRPQFEEVLIRFDIYAVPGPP